MKVWVLERGCRYEGGYIVDLFSDEDAGLQFASSLMQECIIATQELSTEDDPCKTYFEKSNNTKRPGDHYWIEHYLWKSGDRWVDGDSDYVSLTWYELR
jgi:hypothetical protein